MFLFANQSVGKIMLLTSVLFCVCDCGDWDDIFVYENLTMIYPWHKNWTLITTTTTPTITTTTTKTATEAPSTTEQQQTTTNMNDYIYGKREENERSFEFLLPRTLKIGDSLKVSGILRDNPRTVSLSLVTGSNGVDYSNVALKFTATIVEGEHDTYNISYVLDNTREVVFEETPGGKLFFDSKFNFDVTINADTESEERFLFDFFSNDSGLMQNIETKHHLRDIRYLILTGDYEKVEKLQFDFA